MMPTLLDLAANLGAALSDRKWTVATAESCTGGLVAGAITDIAGSSGWFDRGFVTYSNEAKIELLGVRDATLARFGAVSEQTAREMLAGALARSRADLAVAVTGIAGPGGGTEEKPVGTVHTAVAGPAGVRERAVRFIGDRDMVRMQASQAALDMVRLHFLYNGQVSSARK